MKSKLKDSEPRLKNSNNKIKTTSINLLWLRMLKNNYKQL
jgi:hypothetical protein